MDTVEALPLEARAAVGRGDYLPSRTIDAASPFRYPGGKGFLTGYLTDRAHALATSPRQYVEPYAGGAGAALNLLRDGVVDTVHLNDLDLSVYSAWRAIINENDRFVDRVAKVPVTIETWHECQHVLRAGASDYSFELGFATFFVNRTSRAGIVVGSGPIGGFEQEGTWKVDARFYRETLTKRLLWIGENAKRITLCRSDALVFLQAKMAELAPERTIYFVDPPYVHAGSRLYLNAMDAAAHRDLAEFLQSRKDERWIVTYDDHPTIRSLYDTCDVRELDVVYSLARKRRDKELVIEPGYAFD